MNHIEFRNKVVSRNMVNPKLMGLSVVEINPTELCNRKCSFCPRYSDAIYPNRNLNMSVETAKLLNQQLIANDFDGYLAFSGHGEPLLNPDILEIISELSGFFLELITNGDTILKGKHSVEELFRVGIDRILISDYDANPEFEKLKSERVIVRHFTDDGKDNYDKYGFNNRAGAMFSIPEPIPRPCFMPSYKALVDWNGDLLLCSHDWFEKDVFGNIYESDISDIWNSEKLVNQRINLAKGKRDMFKACAKCNVFGDLVGKDSAQIWTK